MERRAPGVPRPAAERAPRDWQCAVQAARPAAPRACGTARLRHRAPCGTARLRHRAPCRTARPARPLLRSAAAYRPANASTSGAISSIARPGIV
jgi:hypothetical protein